MRSQKSPRSWPNNRMKWLPRLPASPVPTDEEAMRAVQKTGDNDAFARIVDRWEQPIRRLCMRMSGDEHRGEDLAQETFARLFTQRQQYDASRKLSTWLWRIALNLCFADARRRQRQNTISLDTSDNDGRIVDGKGATPEAEVSERERARLVKAALASLDEKQRAVVILREYEGLKFREIAEVLELPEGTVKWRMAEALTQLADRLRRTFPDEASQTMPNEPQEKVTNEG